MKKLFQKRKEKKLASKSPTAHLDPAQGNGGAQPYPSPYTQALSYPGSSSKTQPPQLVVPVPQRPPASQPAPQSAGSYSGGPTPPATTPRQYEGGQGSRQQTPRRQPPPPAGSTLNRYTEEEFSRTVKYENQFYGHAQKRATELNHRLEALVDRIDESTGAPKSPRSGRSSHGSNRWTPVPRPGDETSGGEDEDWVWGSSNPHQLQHGGQQPPPPQPPQRAPSGKSQGPQRRGVGMGFNGSFLWGDDAPEEAEGVQQRSRPSSPAPRPRNSPLPHGAGGGHAEPSPPPPPAVWNPTGSSDSHGRPTTPTRGRPSGPGSVGKPRGPTNLQLSPGRSSAFHPSASSSSSRRVLPPQQTAAEQQRSKARPPSPSKDPDPPLGDDSLGCLSVEGAVLSSSLEGAVLSRHASERNAVKDPPGPTAPGSFLSYGAIFREFADGPEGELMTSAGWARYMQLVQKEDPTWPFEGRDAIDFESFRRHCEGPANRLFRDVRHDMTHPLVRPLPPRPAPPRPAPPRPAPPRQAPPEFRALHTMIEPSSAPLSDYFVATSARTWEAPGGPAAGYERALRSGFKCVSVRAWDGASGRPVVGEDPASARADALEILLTIQKHAFAASRWPLVLDVENHCSQRQQRLQAALAAAISDAFRGALVPPQEVGGGGVLPSPERLQNRVLVRARTGRNVAPELAALVLLPKGDLQEEEGAAPRRKAGASGRDAWAGPTLTDLGLFRRLGLASMAWVFTPDSALERTLEASNAMVKLNRQSLSRTEPCGALEGYEEAFVPWLAGFSLVGTLTSKGGRAAQLYSGHFKANLRSGYVLKPPYMRSTGEGGLSGPVPRPQQPRKIRLSIIRGLWVSAAQHELNRAVTRGAAPPRGLSRTPDPSQLLCLWEMVGPKSDSVVYRTRFGAGAPGDEPGAYSGNGVILEFSVYEPLITAFRILVTAGEENVDAEEYVGAYALPVDCIRPGYRTVVLVSPTGQRAFEINLHVHVSGEPQHGRRYSRTYAGTATTGATTTRPSTPLTTPRAHATDWDSAGEAPASARRGGGPDRERERDRAAPRPGIF
eukprot:tig00021070_g17939.t1